MTDSSTKATEDQGREPEAPVILERAMMTLWSYPTLPAAAMIQRLSVTRLNLLQCGRAVQVACPLAWLASLCPILQCMLQIHLHSWQPWDLIKCLLMQVILSECIYSLLDYMLIFVVFLSPTVWLNVWSHGQHAQPYQRTDSPQIVHTDSAQSSGSASDNQRKATWLQNSLCRWISGEYHG